MMTRFDAEALLHRPLMANLATLARDGAPRNAPVWFLWEGGTLWIPSAENCSSSRRLKADPHCAVEIVDFDNAAGRLMHCGLREQAKVVANDPSLFRYLLGKYLGNPAAWNRWFIDNVACIDHPGSRLIALTPDSIFTNNASFFRTGPDLV